MMFAKWKSLLEATHDAEAELRRALDDIRGVSIYDPQFAVKEEAVNAARRRCEEVYKALSDVLERMNRKKVA